MKLADQNIDWLNGKHVVRLDLELQTRITNYLSDQNEIAFRSLQIDVDHGIVTLTGRVRTYYEKQVAMSCVNVVGVLNLIDNLTVPEWACQDREHPFQL